MTYADHESANGSVALAERDVELGRLSLHAATKMDSFFRDHPTLPAVELNTTDRLLFLMLPTPDGDEVEMIVYEHDKKPNFVAASAEDHEQMRTLFVHHPNEDTVDCFEDSMDDEHRMEDAGNFAGVVALRAMRQQAAVDPGNRSPIEKHEALQLTGLLRIAEQQLAS